MSITITMNRYGATFEQKYDTLREALEYIDGAVEHNAAAPVSLTAPSPFFGGNSITFTKAQIYVMKELVRTEED